MERPRLSDAEMQDLREKINRFSDQLSPAQRAYLASTLNEEDVEGHLWNPVLVQAQRGGPGSGSSAKVGERVEDSNPAGMKPGDTPSTDQS